MKVKRPHEKQFSFFMGASNISIDICKVFGGRGQSMFIDMVAKDLKKSTNMLHPCPFQVGLIWMNTLSGRNFKLQSGSIHRVWYMGKISILIFHCFRRVCQLARTSYKCCWWPDEKAIQKSFLISSFSQASSKAHTALIDNNVIADNVSLRDEYYSIELVLNVRRNIRKWYRFSSGKSDK